MAAITLRELTKVYPGGVRALDALDLEIADGEFFALLGPSGCGKSTLLRTIAGLEEATEGSVRLGDEDVTRTPPGRRNVGMVFQDYALFPHMTVTDNIAYPLRIKKASRPERHKAAAEVAGELGLDGLLGRRPGELSGGQQQRVALARAMAARPQVFLLDEPLSNLDARLRLEARTFLKRLQQELGVTTVFVTHDQAEALAMADRIAVMEAGRIRQIGTPREVFRRPANVFVASFIGSTPMNLIDAVVRGDEIVAAETALPLPPSLGEDFAGGQEADGQETDGQEVVYGIRPDYLDFSPVATDGAFGGEVTVVENLGSTSLVTLDVAGVMVHALVGEGEEPAPGDQGWAVPRPGRALVYRNGDLVNGTDDVTVAARA
ncbi:ABC transporter ATP-binding protein [Actinomadura barringtoniae]|uniref:ABC transporter ATP-binding protein n=1 Tax=Actinomadura barringtoniae TaxID=1427535 RepID=A0A939PDZ7_9ACTN|nr:ABC transporter ATP-binding protein [Actinomadura barringtoniae]MBO2450860.1 ABC transporter ATP-binding protein [Actinomadura barringtoniae]